MAAAPKKSMGRNPSISALTMGKLIEPVDKIRFHHVQVSSGEAKPCPCSTLRVRPRPPLPFGSPSLFVSTIGTILHTRRRKTHVHARASTTHYTVLSRPAVPPPRCDAGCVPRAPHRQLFVDSLETLAYYKTIEDTMNAFSPKLAETTDEVRATAGPAWWGGANLFVPHARGVARSARGTQQCAAG